MMRRIPAVFMRGGTSKGLILHVHDLPLQREQWDPLFLALMGSPDVHGRQLNGMGGGVSSLSKICVVGPSTRSDADIDYTFAQVMVDEMRVDYSGNCGNMSSAIGPFAVDEKLVQADDGDALVRIHNTNTGKVIHAVFPVTNGRARVGGELEIPGVSGKGASVQLTFLDPGGATTGRLLPTGQAAQILEVPGLGGIRVSMVDAANACVFVDARDLGLSGTELPAAINGCPDLLGKLNNIRIHASLAMGITSNLEQARAKRVVPFVGFVSPPQAATTLSGATTNAGDIDLTVRMISSGQPHMALQLTVSLCLAAAAGIKGTVVNTVARPSTDGSLRIGMPSGILTAGADVECVNLNWNVRRGYFYRTARRLFDGHVYPAE
ncbi:PrpF family protein [Alcaligenaceae bacterium CGII-47]|nr:PrpF family protein [Alcaligenaceae bacterium CGII-47]